MSNDPLDRHLEGLFSDSTPEPDRSSPSPLPDSLSGPAASELQVAASEPPVTTPVKEEVAPGAGMLSLDEPPSDPMVSRTERVRTRPLRRWEGDDWSVVQEEDLERGRERILNLLLGGVVIGGAVGIVAMILAGIQKPERFLTYIPFFAGYLVIVLLFFWRRLAVRWRSIILFAVAYGVAGLSIWFNGPMSTGPWYLFAVSLFFFVLIGPRAGIVSSVVHTVVFVALVVVYRLGFMFVQSPIDFVDNIAQFLVVIATFPLMAIVMTLVPWLYARTQNQITRRMHTQYRSLQQAQALSRAREEELAIANRVLQRQASHFELGAQVGHLSTRVLQSETFVTRVVALVRERLNLYDVSLYLLDVERENLILQAFSHQDATEISDRATRLRVDDNETLAKCVQTGEACIASHRDQLIGVAFVLPQTRSMLMLPLVAQEKTIGVVAIQSLQDDAFQQSDVVPLRTFADQVAVAIAYDRALVEVQERLREVEALQQYYVREAWQQFLPTQERDLFQFTQPGIAPLGEQEIDHLVTQTSGDGGTSVEGQDLMVPLSQRGHVIGLLGLSADRESQPLDEGQVSMVRAISEQMELILDNARLFEQARMRAGQERKVRDVATRMRETLDVASVLRTAADEMYQALNLDELVIRLAPPESLADEEAQ
ncbi:MAG: GAF domain-containing protein [Anaerolineae bacterium]|nr:GAF domain-containing protein [Anaerolineae bacterium]